MTPPDHPQWSVMIAHTTCSHACCAGCHDCYGMGIGCHQDPCRCGFLCTCRWSEEGTDSTWRAGCERHDTTTDTRKHR